MKTFYEYITEVGKSIDIVEEDIRLINSILYYVLSFGDQRGKALKELENNLEEVDLSKISDHLVVPLPYSRKASRWIDYRGNKEDKVKETIENGECYDRGRKMYSFSLHPPEKLKDNLSKSYGIITEYDLSKMSGSAFPVSIILRFLYNIDNIRDVINKASKKFPEKAQEFITTLRDIGIIFVKGEESPDAIKLEPADPLEDVLNNDEYFIDPDELSIFKEYAENQREIIVNSEDTRYICPENVIEFLE